MKPQKVFLSENLQYLRKRKKISQLELAGDLEISRSKIAHYEGGNSINPPLEDLLAFAGYYKVSIDTLLTVNLPALGELKLRELEAGNDVYISGGKIRVLAISTNSNNKENVEYVPIKAKAGYIAGFNDPGYIATLPKFSFPHLSEKKTYRVFPTEGDSMLPFPENCLVITEYVADWNTLKETPCIVIMKSEQTFLFKVVTTTEERSLLLHSLNPAYRDQDIFVGDVLEVWKYHSHITDSLPTGDNTIFQILNGIKEIKSEIKRIVHK